LVEQEEGRFCMNTVGVVAERPTDRVPFRQQHNTNIVWHGGKLMALVENAYPFEIDPRTLDPRGENNFGGKMLGMSTSAHPKIDGRTGQMLIHGYQPFPPYLQYYVVEPDGRCSVAEHVEAPFPAMMHDLAITENYVVFILSPVVFDAQILLTPGRPVADAFLWQPERGLHFGVRRRFAGAETRWLRAPTSAFIFHPGNAYEENGRIIMDACSYLDGAALLESLRTWRRGEVQPNWYAKPFLYEIDVQGGSVAERQLDERGAEFPRLDDRLVGYRNRYGYASRNRRCNGDSGGTWSVVVRYDRTGGPTAEHDYGIGHWPSEPVFVPRHSAAAEDDGFVLNVVYDGSNDSSYLAILDARNLSGAPLARARLKHRIPMGFHGNFVSADV
jgi:carotenoid cleavage dioxygenase